MKYRSVFDGQLEYEELAEHHSITLSIKRKDNIPLEEAFVIDTGASVSMLKLRDDEVEGLGLLDSSKIETTIGGMTINCSILTIPKLEVGKIVIHNAKFLCNENSPHSILGENILVHLNPYINYAYRRFYYQKNKGALSNIPNVFKCGKVILKGEILHQSLDEEFVRDSLIVQSNESLTTEEEQMLQLIQNNNGILYTQEFDIVTIHSHIPDSLNTCNSLVEKGYLNKNDNKYTLKIRDTEEIL